MESLDVQIVAVLKPLEIKPYTVPHLKALTRSIEHMGMGLAILLSSATYTLLKSTILLHKRAKWRFHVTVAVCMHNVIAYKKLFSTQPI